MNPTNQLGERIRELRKRMRLTQAELAGTDFTKSFISQVEKGITRPSLKSLEIIAERLNQPVTYFLDDSPDSPHSAADATNVEALIETAKQLHLKGRLHDALRVFQDALGKCHASDLRRKGEIRLRKGHAYFRLGMFEMARDCFLTARDDFSKSNATDYLARCLNDLGTSYDHLGEYDRALESYREARRVVSQDPIVNAPYKSTILTNYGTTLARVGKFDAAIEALTEAIDHASSSGDYGQYGRCCATLGHAHANLGNLKDAILWTTRAIDFFRSVGNAERELPCRNNLASYLRRSGDHESSKRASQEALSLGSKLGQTVEIARAHFGLAEVERDEGNIDAAYDHLMRAFTLAPTYAGASDWTSTVVACAEIKPVPAELVEMIERLAAKWKGEPRGLADIHSNLGKIYSRMGNTEKANEHLSKSVDLYRKT